MADFYSFFYWDWYIMAASQEILRREEHCLKQKGSLFLTLSVNYALCSKIFSERSSETLEM